MIAFHPTDLMTIGLLVFLECILSIDNALVLAILAKPLPPVLQKKALTYGLGGAILFRILALSIAGFLMQWVWVKFVGGAYLVYIAISHWLKGDSSKTPQTDLSHKSFWGIVLIIELTDMAFAADSILAAVAVSNKLWIVVTGGILGLIAMRFAAQGFITLLTKFPNFEATAYLLVFIIGAKLLIDGCKFEGINFHSTSSPAFWAFWILTLVAIAYGFKPRKAKEIQKEMKALEAEAKAVDQMEQK